jgi:hypothetical protein
MQSLDQVIEVLPKCLSNDLRKPQYQGTSKYKGYCYIVAEALYYLFPKLPLVPQHIVHENTSHWFLKNKVTGEIIDPTSKQFKTKISYSQARSTGFLTSGPSKKTQLLIQRIKKASI